LIELIKTVPRVETLSAEHIKLRATFEAYGSDGLFWAQDIDAAYLSLIDGNMVIYNRLPLTEDRTEELVEFLAVINPACVFSDLETLTKLDRKPREEISVMHIKVEENSDKKSDELSSQMLYDLLNVEGLSLPDYEHFAVDICYRLNHGLAEYFGIENTCAAISFHTGKFAIMNGIASHKKGFGSIALKNILAKNRGRDFLVCCRQSVKEFYIKNKFVELYKAGYWER